MASSRGFILRRFWWWRVNEWSESYVMIASLVCFILVNRYVESARKPSFDADQHLFRGR